MAARISAVLAMAFGMVLMTTPFNASAEPRDNLQIDLPDFSARVKQNDEKAFKALKAKADTDTRKVLSSLSRRVDRSKKESRGSSPSYFASQTQPDSKPDKPLFDL